MSISDETKKRITNLHIEAWNLRLRNVDKAFELATEALGLSQKGNWDEGIAMSFHQLGEYYRIKRDFEESFKNYNAAIEIRTRIDDQRGLATSIGNTGLIWESQGEYSKALESYFKALQIDLSINNNGGIARHYGNIGNTYIELGEYKDALEFYFKALAIDKDSGNKRGMAFRYGNIGIAYRELEDYHTALKYYFKALDIDSELENEDGIARHFGNISVVYNRQGDYENALLYYKKALKAFEKNGSIANVAVALTNIGIVHYDKKDYDQALKYQKQSLEINEAHNIKDEMAKNFENIGLIYMHKEDYEKALQYFNKALSLADKMSIKGIKKNVYGLRSNLYSKIEEFKLALEDLIAYNKIKDESHSALKVGYGFEKQERESEIQHLKNVELKQEKDRSDRLLLNIFPIEVAEELKQNDSIRAKLYKDITVMFTDFKGFTLASKSFTPEDLVNELHECFKGFDRIISIYNIEKIKTIGDAYMAVSGLPTSNPLHAIEMAKAACEIRDFMLERKKNLGDKTFEMRLGLNSGSAIAGVVGVKKYAYDIWGDTVNIAARMEQNSEVGKINISESTYNLVKHLFPCTYRGEIEAKNGGVLKMFFID